jgi:predicted ATP-dependent endonuclease of OLD family
LFRIPDTLQGTVRANPEAFFAKRVIVCEGATEVGLIRALNNWRIQSGHKSLTYLGVRYADGGGKSLTNYTKAFRQLEYDTCLVCDSDDENVNKESLCLPVNSDADHRWHRFS